MTVDPIEPAPSRREPSALGTGDPLTEDPLARAEPASPPRNRGRGTRVPLGLFLLLLAVAIVVAVIIVA